MTQEQAMMDGFILMRVDSWQNPSNVSYIGTFDTFEDAHDVMATLYENELARSGMDDDEMAYACLIEGRYAQIAPPHGRGGVTLHIFDMLDDITTLEEIG